MNKMDMATIVQNYVVDQINNKLKFLGINARAEVYNDYIAIVKTGSEPGFMRKDNIYMPKRIWKTRNFEKIMGYIMTRL